MKRLLFSLLFFLSGAASAKAQVIQELLDQNLRPAKKNIRYTAVTEKRDSLWYRELTFLTEQTKAGEGWYRDSACLIPHGIVTMYYPNQALLSRGTYVDGKKEGPWLRYSEKGDLMDSSNYVGGWRKGIFLRRSPDGRITDSTHFDGAGNGFQVSWYENGSVQLEGHFISDTTRTGLWNFYHLNGQLWARAEYKDGKVTTVTCFDSTGKKYPPEECRAIEASFPGGDAGWRQFLERNINGDIAARNGAPPGNYTVVVQFIIDPNGEVGDIRPLTSHGYGMEAEVLRLLRRSPKWKPARYWGKYLKAYHKQPVTFSVIRR